MNSRGGFTLVEVVLAVAILAFGIVGVLRAYGTSVRVLSAEQDAVDEVFLLGQRMGEVELVSLTKDGLMPGTVSGVFSSGFNGVGWRVEVVPVMVISDESGVPEESGFCRVTVTVLGREGDNSRKFSLSTYMDSRDEVFNGSKQEG